MAQGEMGKDEYVEQELDEGRSGNFSLYGAKVRQYSIHRYQNTEKSERAKVVCLSKALNRINNNEIWSIECPRLVRVNILAAQRSQRI